MPEGDLDILRAQAAKKALEPSEEAQRKHSWDLNVISQDPKDPQKSFAMTGSPGSDPKRLYVGDFTPEGDAVVGFENQGIRLLPEQPGSKEYTRYMGDKVPTPAPDYAAIAAEANEASLEQSLAQKRLGAALRAVAFQEPDSVDDFDPSLISFGSKPLENEGALVDDQRVTPAEWGDYEATIDAQIKAADFPDPRTEVAVKNAFNDMWSLLDDKPRLLSTTPEHQDGIPDRIYFESENGERWEWVYNDGQVEAHRADEDEVPQGGAMPDFSGL